MHSPVSRVQPDASQTKRSGILKDPARKSLKSKTESRLERSLTSEWSSSECLLKEPKYPACSSRQCGCSPVRKRIASRAPVPRLRFEPQPISHGPRPRYARARRETGSPGCDVTERERTRMAIQGNVSSSLQ